MTEFKDSTCLKVVLWAVLGIVTVGLLSDLVGGCTAHAAPPDPWVRMTRPSGCSGGIFHASRQHGIWIATCKHCVSRPGRVDLVFFDDGQRAKVTGQFVQAHPRYDCAIVWCAADRFWELPRAVPLAGPDVGPFRGQAVYAVGSYAGGTITPAARHIAISSVSRGAYEFYLNDSAWGGHSGGAVVDANSGRLLGVLWGTTGGRSIITSNRALLETLIAAFRNGWSRRDERRPAMFSVEDDLSNDDAEAVRYEHDITVRGPTRELLKIQREVITSHYLRAHFDWDWDHENWLQRPRVEWEVAGKKWYIDGWNGQDDFIVRFQKTGGPFT